MADKENNKNIRKNNSNKINKRKRLSPREEMERKRDRRKKQKRSARIQAIFSVIIIVIFLLTAFIGINIYSFISHIENENIIAGEEPLGNESLNILLVGMDIGDSANPTNQNARRTDTIMLYNYNPVTKVGKIISIPRDTLIEVENAYENNVYMPYWKINSAYTLGGEEELIEQVEKLMELNVNYIVEINYSAFRNFIDSIGGIEMYIEQDMKYDDNKQDLHIDFKGGETVLLDGKGAEEFFRWRKNNDGTGLATGDIGRIENQQKFMSKVIEKCIKPSMIFKLPGVLNIIEKDVVTNMGGSEILSAALTLLKCDSISMHTLEGKSEYLYGKSFLVVDKESNRELLDSLKSGNTLDNPLDRETYKIKVLNGTRVNGLAGNLQVELEKLGYKEIFTGNYNKLEKSIILSNNEELSKQLRSETGINRSDKNKEDEYKDYDAVIIIGEDYLVFGN